MRIQLDIPETQMANAIELLALRGQIVNVIIEPLKEQDNERKQQGDTRKIHI